MATAKTVFSELHVTKEIANCPVQNLNITSNDIIQYNSQLQRTSPTTITHFNTVASRIRNYLIRQGITPSATNTLWQGHRQQSRMTLVSTDILIASQQKISVKEESDNVHNASPDIVFNKIPSGQLGQKGRRQDWFQVTANLQLNNYYIVCKQQLQSINPQIFNSIPLLGQINNVADFYSNYNTQSQQRKDFGRAVRQLHNQGNQTVLNAYQIFCDKVSQESAHIFNQNIQNLMSSAQSAHSALSPLFHYFFRVNSTAYILCGIESRPKQPFAIIIPASSTWTHQYRFISIQALSIPAGQPEVRLSFSLKDNRTNQVLTFDMRVEIRWSHGKFCGNPEAKIYKDFSYTSLPWVTVL